MTHNKALQPAHIRDMLKRLRAARKFTQKQVAEKLGVATVTVSGWEIGKRIPEPHMLSKIAGVFGITVDNLLGHSTKPQSVQVGDVVFVPIYGSVAVIEGRLAFLDYHGTYPVPTEAATVPRGVQAVLIAAPDASMASMGISPEALVLVHVNAKVRPGDVCIAIIDSGRPCLRQCCQNNNEKIVLKAADPASAEETYVAGDYSPVRIVGPCVAVFQMLPRGKGLF